MDHDTQVSFLTTHQSIDEAVRMHYVRNNAPDLPMAPFVQSDLEEEDVVFLRLPKRCYDLSGHVVRMIFTRASLT